MCENFAMKILFQFPLYQFYRHQKRKLILKITMNRPCFPAYRYEFHYHYEVRRHATSHVRSVIEMRCGAVTFNEIIVMLKLLLFACELYGWKV